MIFEEIYQIYSQKVFRLCMGYVNDHDWAQDISQETFITVWQQLPKFRNESSIGTWIFRIASNHCLRQIEKKSRIPAGSMPLQVEAKQDQNNEAKISFLYKCISELNEIDRIIISLELEDIRQTEIAEIVGISAANVRIRVHRIKDKLSQKFKEYER